MEIAALVSGGVDSSVMVPILKEQGYNPHIFYIKIGLEGKDDLMDCPSEEDIEITTYIAKKYGCAFDIVDLQKEYYERVASYTMDSVRKGLTPNPDVMCNRMIKFGAFEEKWAISSIESRQDITLVNGMMKTASLGSEQLSIPLKTKRISSPE